MNRTLINRLFLLSSILISLVSPNLRADDGTVVVDFSTKGFNYGYDGWAELSSVTQKSDRGTTLNGPAAGGVGIVLENIQDLTGNTSLKIKLKVGGENTAQQLRLIMISADNKKSIWDFDYEKQAAASDGVIVLDLLHPDDISNGPADLEVVKQLQLQGKYTPGEKVDVELEQLSVSADTAPAK